MSEMQTRTKPPYPTLGEVCQLLATAFDTKSTDANIRKKLDRLAREGDYDWTIPSKAIESLLLEPLRNFDPDFADFLGGFVQHLLREHVNLLSHVQLDALSREEAAPLLIEHFYAGHLASFIVLVLERFGGPDLYDFLREDANPIDTVCRWAETSLELPIAHRAYPENKQKRDDIGRWRRRDTIPEFHASLRPLRSALIENNPEQLHKITLLSKWLLMARVLAWLDRECGKAGLGDLMTSIRREIKSLGLQRDVGRILSLANIKAAERLKEVAICGGLLRNERLKRTAVKQQGDQSLSRVELDAFEALLDEHDSDRRARYMLDWCEGRWHVLAGREEEALHYYEEATNQALYRAGPNQEEILEEATALAAYLGKRTAVKRLKHRALAMGLFSNLFAEFQGAPDVVSDWEIKQLGHAFSHLFPLQGRFVEAKASTPSLTALPFGAIDLTAAEKLKSDLKKPNRVISVPTLDGSTFRRPQLMWFAAMGQVDHVRRLLEAGADVNVSDETGRSALLNALQCGEAEGGQEVLDLLFERPHDIETLNRLTKVKRLSPLYQAVLLGDPVIVSRLLAMGADPNQAAGYPPQSPLYICIVRFGLHCKELVTEKFLSRLTRPSIEDQEILRRHTGGLAGVFGDRRHLVDMSNPRHAKIMDGLLEHTAGKAAEVPRDHLLQIAKVLLEHGADPNRKHVEPGPGRTPLMVAAEIDAVDVFQMMVSAGGDPLRKDDQGNDCLAIARAFESIDVLETLRNYS